MRRNLVGASVLLAALVLAVGLTGVLYEEELLRATERIYRALGVGGLLVIVFLSDSITTPIPPDVVLIVIAKSSLEPIWVRLVGIIGVVSVVAGNLAWFLGTKLGEVPLLERWFSRVREKNRALVARYGRWAVALGALTPIPFSVTCWSAGILKMPFRDIFLPTLLRFPRFFLYYALIASSAQVMRSVF